MLLNMPKVLLLGVCSLFVLMGLSQAVTMWWFQQQLQQQLSEQSQALSRIILARTAEKLQHQFVFSTAPQLQVFTGNPASAPDTQAPDKKATSQSPARTVRQLEVRHLDNGTTVMKVDNLPAQVLPAATSSAASEVSAGSSVSVGSAASSASATALNVDLKLQLENTLSELKQPGAGQQHWVQRFRLENSDSSQQLVGQYLRYQLLALALSIVLALLLAIWLGARLLQPLQQLVGGFRALAQGQAGIQLDTTAPLAEYRFALQQFNLASRELAALQAQKTELARQQQLVELGEISRGLVHALRNPIHTMALALEQLATTQPQAALQQLIEQKMQHINRTLTALLTLSCQGVDRSQPVSLQAVLKDLALEFYHAGLQLALPDAPCQLPAAEAELRTIFHAVISNAVEASPQPGTVQVRLQESADAFVLEVQDQGAGIAPALLPQLFSPHISSKAEGAGMGLYLAKRLLELYYRGTIVLENLPAGGVRAGIRLAKAAEVADEC